MDREACSRLIATRSGGDWAAPEKIDERQGFDRREEQNKKNKTRIPKDGI